MKIAIVEDNKEYSSTLLKFIQDFGKEHNVVFSVQQYFNGYQFLDECQKEDFNIVFMDIMMPGIDGMETAKRFRAINEEASLIFVTNMAQFAINGYDVGAIDFIVKPVSYTNFSLKFCKVLAAEEKKDHSQLQLKSENGIVILPCKEIYFIESFGHYMTFHTKQGAIISRQSLRDVMKSLPEDQFKQCSKSYVVNINHVKRITSESLFVPNEKNTESEIPISRKLKNDFMTYLLQRS